MNFLPAVKRGFVLAVSAPSGTGKTVLCDRLAEELSFVVRSVSVTTRPKREGEVPNRDYSFVSPEEFQKLRRGGHLLELAEVFGNWYGTPRKVVEEAMEAGKVIVMDIDTVGAMEVKKILKEDCVTLFILPPSLEELERRLKTRGKDSVEVLQKRLKEASKEMGEAHRYEYIIGNETLEEAFLLLKAIVVAERAKRTRLVFQQPVN